MVAGRDTAVEPLLYNAEQFGWLIGCSRSKVFSMLAAGQLPPSVKLGNSRRWSRTTIEKWVDLNCPSLDRFLSLTKETRK